MAILNYVFNLYRAMDNDDYDGVCGNGRFPLISTVSNLIRGGTPTSPPGTTTNPPIATTTRAPATTTTQSSGGAFSCPSSAGFFKDPANCAKFYQCANSFPYSMSCGSGLQWNDKVKACDWPSNVFC